MSSSRFIQCAVLVVTSLFMTSFAINNDLASRRQEMFERTLKTFNNFNHQAHRVFPRRVTRDGEFVDHVTLGPLATSSSGGIAKRNVRENTLSPDDEHHEVFYDLGTTGSPLDGAKVHIKRNYNLVSQNFVVEERSRGGKIALRHSDVEECHYTGVIHNHEGYSKVALSVCNGLQGVIFKDDDMFFIEPSWNQTTEAQQSHEHVIIKRSALEHLVDRRKDKDDLGHCGFSDEEEGEAPWWKIDPRSSRKETNEDKRKGNHRTSAGRSDKEESGKRVRRSVSKERNVELMVVADKAMVSYHGQHEAEKYILTIMNIVGNLYHDATIGNAVNIIVTRIVLLTEDQPDLHISHHADQSLNSFCRWQSGININGSSAASDSGLAHHDNAVLLTGFDICTFENKPCGTLGLAPVAGMCESERSCNINEDTGLSSAFTIAHEIGHNFGMQHDGNHNDCGLGPNEPAQMMAPRLTKGSSPFTWSQCSKKYITNFLDSGSGECLLDSPPLRDFAFPEELPGQLHDADEQCRFQFGPQSRQCVFRDVCSELWCRNKNGDCVTNSIPSAEGTSCSTRNINKGWCYRGDCVPFGFRAGSVDGQWGSWSSWNQCSRSCGTGVSSSARSCENPAPEHGGKYCIGERRRYRTCNTQLCPGPVSDFRQEQCAKFDNEPFRGKFYNWRAFVGGPAVKACALNCLAQGYNFYTERAAAVVDGTRCFADSLDMCINGECHEVGCDHVLHSDAIEDKCRVCGGDGSTCHTEAGVFNAKVMHGQYHQVVTIPKGSVNIFIQELSISRQNYIALKNLRNENYINGEWTIDWPRKFEVAGTTFSYERPSFEPETLKAAGPTTEDLIVMILLQEPNRGLKYEYNVPIVREGSADAESAFLWNHGDWTPCTASCAGGTQRKAVICRRVDDDTEVQHSYCNPRTMPTEQVQSCNAEPCPPMWSSGSWSSCSRTCGGGHRTRTVVCKRALTDTEDEVIDAKYCSGSRPRSSESCNEENCPPQWSIGEWTQCKPSCGAGWKSRKVTCKSANMRATLPNERCDPLQKPVTRAHCNNDPCPPPQWRYSKWGACSAKCGRGQKRRRVACYHQGAQRPHSECSGIPKPRSTQSCETPCGSSSEIEVCVDDPKVKYCPLVLKFKFCHREYFRKMCCTTCSKV